MAEIAICATNYTVWVCPRHGVIGEDELAEGVDWSAGMQMDGDVRWTDRFYCQRDGHEDGDDHEAVLVDVEPEIRAALASREQPATNEDAS